MLRKFKDPSFCRFALVSVRSNSSNNAMIGGHWQGEPLSLLSSQRVRTGFFHTSRLSSQVTADTQEETARRWDGFRVADDSPTTSLLGSHKPVSGISLA